MSAFNGTTGHGQWKTWLVIAAFSKVTHTMVQVIQLRRMVDFYLLYKHQ